MKTQAQQVRELKRKLTPVQTPEDIENIIDVVASTLVAGANVSIVYDDPADTITISSSGVTTIVGITGTKAEFNTALTGGDFLFVGDITQYTDEMAQDAVGGILGASIVYSDATPSVQRAALSGDATAAQDSNVLTLATVNADTGSWGLAASVAQFVVNAKGLITSAVNVPIAITSAAVSGLGALATLSAVGTTEITNLAVTTAKIAVNAVTNGKLAQMAAKTIKANITSSTADPDDVTLPLALGALHGYTETATAAGTTTLTNASTMFQTFTGSTTQTVVLPTASAAQPGFTFIIKNLSTGALTVNANSGALVVTIAANEVWMLVCDDTSGSGANAWVTTLIDAPKKFEMVVACSDETTALTTGTAKVTFRMPRAITLTAVRASVTTAPTGGTLLTVDINESGATILSTKLTFDASEKTTTTATTPAIISDTALADDAEITIDIDAIGSTIAGAGLKIALIGFYA